MLRAVEAARHQHRLPLECQPNRFRLACGEEPRCTSALQSQGGRIEPGPHDAAAVGQTQQMAHLVCDRTTEQNRMRDEAVARDGSHAVRVDGRQDATAVEDHRIPERVTGRPGTGIGKPHRNAVEVSTRIGGAVPLGDIDPGGAEDAHHLSSGLRRERSVCSNHKSYRRFGRVQTGYEQAQQGGQEDSQRERGKPDPVGPRDIR